MRVDVDEAQKHFSRLIAAVENGENVTIYRDGKAIIECRPVVPSSPFPFGAWATEQDTPRTLDHMVGPTHNKLLNDMDL